MKPTTIPSSRAFWGTLAAAAALAALLVVPARSVQAATSGGATIFNEATVTYNFAGVPKSAKGSTSVTVLTVAAKPAVTVDTTAQNTVEATTVTYNYKIINQSNGPVSTLAVTTPLTSTPASLTAATDTPAPGTPSWSNVWGGIVVSSAAGTITLPGGSVGSLVAGTSKVAIKSGGVWYYYLVSTIGANNAASPGSAEQPAVLTLTPTDGNSTAVSAAIAPSGAVAGEYKPLAMAQLTGTVSSGNSGTYLTDITATATDASAGTQSYTTTSGDNNEVTTTVYKSPLSVTKTSDKASGAKPGDTITYTITVTNTTNATANNAYIKDPLSPYVTYVGSSTTLNGKTVSGDGITCPLSVGSGLEIDDDTPARSAGAVATGNIASGKTATIVYKVTVN
jgi:uncharacterized repeat protein (TIGR01451 family)